MNVKLRMKNYKNKIQVCERKGFFCTSEKDELEI